MDIRFEPSALGRVRQYEHTVEPYAPPTRHSSVRLPLLPIRLHAYQRVRQVPGKFDNDGLVPDWNTYEELATFLLGQFVNEFGLERVEGKQHIGGVRSGTVWEIDAKGICEDGTGFVIVEYRRYTTSK